MGRRAIVLLVALILAGLAAWAVWNFLDGVRSEAEAEQVQVTVYRAAEPIAEGAEGGILLSGQELIVESTEEQVDLPDDAITTQEELNSVLTGRVAAGPISANAILTRSQWTEVTIDVTPLAELIPSGKQAITIGMDNIGGVNGFVEAGDRVNLIVTLDIAADVIPADFPTLPDQETGGEGATGEAETITVTYTRYVLQGLPVLAVGRNVRLDEDAPTVIDVEPDPTTDPGIEGEPTEEETGNETVFTLEVTPEEAERLAFAFENGSMWMTLVPEDFVEVETSGVIIDTLFGGNLLDDIFQN
ncbi:MAG: Flp pilus assembly protein CpaB [Actinobacteria bacterium]|nr:MAG: Flp pilus assembly protein CpaB [Actinomycetota bacterium]